MSTVNRLLAQKELLDKQLEKALARPVEPTPDEDGANVVWFQVSYPNSPVTYTYAAVQARGKWWLTGQDASTGRTWEQLLDWLDNKNAELVSMWHAASWEQI